MRNWTIVFHRPFLSVRGHNLTEKTELHELSVSNVLLISAWFGVSDSVNECWMCPGGESSFAKCDNIRVKQDCKGLDACGIFSYENQTGYRIFAKSCTYKSWCGDKDEFCQNIIGGGRYCRVQCCYSDLCNYVATFRSTTRKPPATTQSVSTTLATTEPQDTSTKEPDMTTTPDEPEVTTTGSEATTRPDEGTAEPLDWDAIDCSWIYDTASLNLSSDFVVWTCALFTMWKVA